MGTECSVLNSMCTEYSLLNCMGIEFFSWIVYVQNVLFELYGYRMFSFELYG